MKISYNKIRTALKMTPLNKNIESDLKELYHAIVLDYPKFFKMDNLCKLGVLGTELLVRNNKNLFKNKANVGVVFQNKSSSLDSDIKHQSGIDNDTVSPAVFVYTLPNIVIGEISIKHQWQSEGIFFLNNVLDYELLSQYSNILIKEKRTEINLVGWVELLNQELKLKLCVIESETSKENLEKIFANSFHE